MPDMARLTINWTGFSGGPGFTNFTFAPAAGSTIDQAVVDHAITKLDTWLDAWQPSLPTVVTTGIDPTVEVFDDATGDLQAFLTGTPGAPNAGTSSAGSWAAGVGACVNWYTEGIRNARRVRGRSFMVPLGTSGLDPDGTLSNTRLTTWRTATTALLANDGASKIAVWSRPSGPEATDGISYDVTSFTINDKVAMLRSRRD